ncbi:MAG: ATP-binding cassette domain-containing protein [Kyrpidia sp.]|nr:ATP-binding cassette domain-containing protein [Kyrpidia sp.]
MSVPGDGKRPVGEPEGTGAPWEMSPAVEVRGLTKRFGDVRAVDGVDFAVAQGECFGLLGPNGAGKSTTIKMLITLLPPDEGEAWVAGYSLRTQARRVREAIGYVPQALSVDGTLTGYENLLLFSRLYGLPRVLRKARVEETLERLGLIEAAHRPVRTYSGGMIRRLEIGQAVLNRPRVLFLDEPTVGLDPLARQGVWDHIRRLQQEHGMTVVLTTHYMEEAESLCYRVAMMSRGRIAALGTPDELRAEIGKPDATLEDVFAHFAGAFEHESGGMRDVLRSRRTARRLG